MDDTLVNEQLLPARVSRGHDVLWITAIALIYFVAARTCLVFALQPEGIAAIWPPAGVFLSVILLTRRDLRPYLVAVLFLTDAAAERLSGTPLPVSAVYALALTGDATLGAWLLVRFVGEPFTFGRVRDVAGWLGLSVVLSNALTSLAAAAASMSVPGAHAFWMSWQSWAAADGVGNLLVTPFILAWASWARTQSRRPGRRRMLEGTALVAATALLNVALFTRLPEHRLFLLFLPYVTFPFLLWAALRFGVRGVAAALLTLAVITVSFAATNQVSALSFAPGRLDDVIVVQLLLAVMAIPALFLAAVVAEREHVEVALRSSEKRSRAFIEHGVDFVSVLAMDGTLLWDSPTATRPLGYPPGAFLGRNIAELVHPDDLGRVQQALAQVVRAPDVTERGVFRLRRHDESWCWVEAAATNLRHDDSVGGIVINYHDITERMQAEEEQAKLAAQLRQAQKMESIGRLAGGVAHDFNNMLGVILGHAELAIGRTDASTVLHDDLQAIRKAATRSADLTAQLLAFARKQIVTPRVLNLNDIVAGTLKMLQRFIGEDIHLVWRPAADLWTVRVDPSQIDQMLTNLCVNARDAINGVGRITIETRQRTVGFADVVAQTEFVPGDYVELRVSDDGGGMDADTLSHLFEPFFTTKAIGQGTGLGLATVHGIVAQNGGFIHVDSQPNRGTTLRVYLPRYAGTVEATRTDAAATPALRGQETILLVEDESDLLSMTMKMLERQGYRVLPAGTPGDAVRLAAKHRGQIHLLLTDVVMPEMNGYVLARNLRALDANLKCLFMSGYTADVIARHGVLDDGVHFVQKPFSIAHLASMVRKVLNADAD